MNVMGMDDALFLGFISCRSPAAFRKDILILYLQSMARDFTRNTALE